MSNAQKTADSWVTLAGITGLAVTVEGSGESLTLKLEPELLLKLPQVLQYLLKSKIENFWSE